VLVCPKHDKWRRETRWAKRGQRRGRFREAESDGNEMVVETKLRFSFFFKVRTGPVFIDWQNSPTFLTSEALGLRTYSFAE
jgi:hypothetical protein